MLLNNQWVDIEVKQETKFENTKPKIYKFDCIEIKIFYMAESATSKV